MQSELPPTRKIRERAKGERSYQSYVPPTSQNPSHWNPSWLSNVSTIRKDHESDDWPETTPNWPHHHKTWNFESHGRAALGSLTLLLSTRASLPNKVSCFVIMWISLNNSFPSVRQEPTLGPWKGVSFPTTEAAPTKSSVGVLSTLVSQCLLFYNCFIFLT